MYCVLEMSTEVSIVPKPPVRVPGFEVNFCSSQTMQMQHYCFTVAEKDMHCERVSLLPWNDSSKFEPFGPMSFEKSKKQQCDEIIQPLFKLSGSVDESLSCIRYLRRTMRASFTGMNGGPPLKLCWDFNLLCP